MTYVETSVLLPAYTPEQRSAEANRILESSPTVLISDLTVAEFYVGLVRKVRRGEITHEQSGAARSLFDSHLGDGSLRRMPLMPVHYEAAGDLAERSPVALRTLDALHLAVATGLGKPIATFDRRLAEAAVALGFEAIP